ncbi:MAG: diadenylate cyclase, partial [Bryobacteraceae bacterium]
MSNPFTDIASQIHRLTPAAAVDILCVAFLIYQFFVIVRGRRAAHILIGLGVVGLVYEAAVYAHLELLRSLLETLVPYTAFALIVVFQSEIRRVLARLGRSRLAGMRELERRELADEVVLAAGQLSRQKTGALIVLERQIGLRTFIESGVSIDGRLSSDLLCAIFHPGGALHDGAVILQGNRIAAAACFLPLATNPAALTSRGTRHRAAIG